MNKILKKYLFLLSALLLSAFANLYANSSIKDDYFVQNSESLEHTTYTSADQEINITAFNSLLIRNENKLFVELTNSEDIEEDNEDDVISNNKFLSIGSSETAIFYVQLSDNLSCKLQEYVYRFKYHSNTSLRLYAKFQVFII